MEFTLFYRGELKANGEPAHKHRIRRCIHRQLREHWHKRPGPGRGSLSDIRPDPNRLPIILQQANFRFLPYVNQHDGTVAELDIVILRPEAPGRVITQGGDIDNRLKTLFDSLKVPSRIGELPNGIGPTEDETPFFCLVEDDQLITGVRVVTDRLFDPVTSSSEVVMLVKVLTKSLESVGGKIGL